MVSPLRPRWWRGEGDQLRLWLELDAVSDTDGLGLSIGLRVIYTIWWLSHRPTLGGEGAFGVDRPCIGNKISLQSHLRPKRRHNFSVFDIDQVSEEPVSILYRSHICVWLPRVSSI